MSRDYMKRDEWLRMLSQARQQGFRRLRHGLKVAGIAYVILGVVIIMGLSLQSNPSLAGVFLGLLLVSLIMIVPAVQYGLITWLSLRAIHALAQGNPNDAHVYLKVVARDDHVFISRGLWIVILPTSMVSRDDFETVVRLSDGAHKIRKLDS